MNFVHKFKNTAWQISNCKSGENLVSLIEDEIHKKNQTAITCCRSLYRKSNVLDVTSSQ